MYLACLRLLLFLRLVSYPTVNSIICKQLSFVVRSKSGRYLSPVTIEGLRNPGRSTKSFLECLGCRILLAMKLSTESCLQVKRFKYELQPATTCNKDSGLRQKKQSAVEDKPHFARFLRSEGCCSGS